MTFSLGLCVVLLDRDISYVFFCVKMRHVWVASCLGMHEITLDLAFLAIGQGGGDRSVLLSFENLIQCLVPVEDLIF